MTQPLAIDLFCGLGGWSEGLLAAGFRVVGFDVERHAYGDHAYPGQLVLQDVLTIHGSQLKDAALIVASPPCTEFSYMAMPWKRAKRIAAALRGEGDFPDGYKGSRTVAELTALFDACFRIRREAEEASGRKIPLVVENVRGAQPWVGRAEWAYGSYLLWGDVPALMPITAKRPAKVPGLRHGEVSPHWRMNGEDSAIKNAGGSWFNIGSPGQKETGRNPVHEHIKHGGEWWHDPASPGRQGGLIRSVKDGRKAPRGTQWFNDGPRTPESLASSGSKSAKRKAASALIAKIPFRLARWIGDVYFPARAIG